MADASPSLPLPPPPLPDGNWAAAVSGGADSMALLHLYAAPTPHGGRLTHVLHLDHQTRAGASTEDAAFVRDSCARLQIPCTLALRSDIEPHLPPPATASLSARYRAVRLAFYRQVIEREALTGVLLAHHADDVAETVALRLLRGSAAPGLSGIRPDALVHSVRLHRPLLPYRKRELIAYLRSHNLPWREDASNTSPDHARNRIRAALAVDDHLTAALLDLASAAITYTRSLDAATFGQHAASPLPVGTWNDLPRPLASHAARRWLSHHLPPSLSEAISPALIARFLAWSSDAAGPPRFNLPANTHAHRRRGLISIDQPEQVTNG